MLKYAVTFFAGIILTALCFTIWWQEPVIKTVTVIEPAKIIYQLGPQPTPKIIEKIVVKDNMVSFKQDIPFNNKQIKGDLFDVVYSGIYHVSMENNLASVAEKIIGNVKTSVSLSEHPPPMNEVGLFYSTFTRPGVYYRRYFGQILIFHPWAEISVGENAELKFGLPIKF